VLNAVPGVVAEAKQAYRAVSAGGALHRPIDTPTADLPVWGGAVGDRAGRLGARLLGAVPTVARRRPPVMFTSEPSAATVADVLVAHLRPAATHVRSKPTRPIPARERSWVAMPAASTATSPARG
jgi:hypothetical protein